MAKVHPQAIAGTHAPVEGADQTVYLVIDRFARLGSVYRETEAERADLETIITDLKSGQFNDPIRVESDARDPDHRGRMRRLDARAVG